MDTRDFDYVLAVNECGGIGRAAEKIGISQPALTKAIQRVEATIGLPLFERSGLGMKLTQAGLLFLERAKRISLEYEDVLKEMRGIRTGEQGIVRLGYSPSMPSALVLGACRQLLRERPVAKLKLTRRLARELMELLLNGTIDLAVAPVPHERTHEFVVTNLFDDRLFIVADEHHPLLQLKDLVLADLVDEEWLLPSPQFGFRQQIESAFRARRLPEPNLRIEIDFSSTLLFDLIKGTRTLTVAGQDSTQSATGLRPISLLQEELDLRRKIGVMARAGAYLPPLAHRMRAILEEHAAVKPV
jgi:DNA-binding transcriptional LysR family regulator